MTYIFKQKSESAVCIYHALPILSVQSFVMLKHILVVVFLVLLCIVIVAMVYQELCLLLKECWNSP